MEASEKQRVEEEEEAARVEASEKQRVEEEEEAARVAAAEQQSTAGRGTGEVISKHWKLENDS